MSDEQRLLREYADKGSDAAFEALAARYLNLVYSAALRRTGEPAMAEEITQAVFIILARKAGSLGPNTVLSGWLYRTALYVAADALRSQRRRQEREQEAYMNSIPEESSTEIPWQELAPLLDEGMARLGRADRDALVLRFFEGRSLGEVGLALGVGEEAARKRVHRAVGRLRGFFARRGVVASAVMLTGAISANSVQAAPVDMIKAISVVAATKGAAAAASTLALVKAGLQGTVKLTWLKLTTVAAIVANLMVSREIVASHFDFAGRPDAWMTRSQFWLWAALVEIGFPLFFVAVGFSVRLRPVNQFTLMLAPGRRDEMRDCIFHNYLWMACFAALHMLAILLLVIYANHQTPPHFPTWAAFGVAGCFIAAVLFRFRLMYRYFKQIS